MLMIFLSLMGCAVKQKSSAEEFRGQTAEQIFKKGENLIVDKKYTAATKPLEALNALYPFSPYQQQAQLDLMYAYYKADDFASTAIAAERYIHIYPRDKNVDYAYYMKGMAHFSQDRGMIQRYVNIDVSKRDLAPAKEAFSDFAELIRRFPASSYAYDARERMIFLRNMMAKHEYDVAELYFRREMYVAAQNRANYVVRHYQQSPEVIPALGLIVETGRKIGLNDLSEQSMKILAYNYPDSKTYQDLQKKYNDQPLPPRTEGTTN